MFKIELTEDDLVLLGRLLPEHPYKLVDPLLRKINEQIQEQLAQRAQAKPEVTNG